MFYIEKFKRKSYFVILNNGGRSENVNFTSIKLPDLQIEYSQFQYFIKLLLFELEIYFELLLYFILHHKI